MVFVSSSSDVGPLSLSATTDATFATHPSLPASPPLVPADLDSLVSAGIGKPSNGFAGLKPSSSHSLFDADFPVSKPNVYDDKVLDAYTNFINFDAFEGGCSAPSSQTSAILNNFAATFSGQIQPHSSYILSHDIDYRAQLNAGLDSPLEDDSPYSPPTDHFDTVCPSDTSPAWANECLATPQLGMATLGLFGSSSPEATDSGTTIDPFAVHGPVSPSLSPSASTFSSTVDSNQEEADIKPVLVSSDIVVSPEPDTDTPFVKSEPSSDAPTPSSGEESDYRPPSRDSKKRKASLTSSSSRSRSRSSTTPLVAGGTEFGPRDPVTGHRIFNGVRPKNSVQPVLSLDAPIQTRKYIGASATSRKVVPKAMEGAIKRQVGAGRSSRGTGSARKIVEAFKEADESELLGAAVPEEVRDAVKAKREQNTLAARESRKRKAEYVEGLENEVERLRGVEGEVKRLRARLEKYEKV